ncbi:hypothetical protein MKY34_20950 [Sporosarcina sp. FSL K6-1522]|uniref:hypothetical protein n=1 Tax=Sporosarcina sp. FSL K6-1522 TaxID=2921554 RepID=UPI003159FD8A
MKHKPIFSVIEKETFHDATDSAEQTIDDLQAYRLRHPEQRYSRSHLDPAAGDYEPIIHGKDFHPEPIIPNHDLEKKSIILFNHFHTTLNDIHPNTP